MAADGYQDRPDWDLRPWLLAGLGALAGLVIHFVLGDGPFYANPPGALKTASEAVKNLSAARGEETAIGI